jgi:hypothetical protein
MADLGEIQRRLASLRAVRDEARTQLRRGVFEVRDLEDAITAEQRRAGRDGQARVEELERQREAAVRRLSERREALDRAQRGTREAGAILLDNPRTLIEQMVDGVPFLLLPVRIETKFAVLGESSELQVRIFPDDVAVTLHEKALTAQEAQAGRDYWKARALANALDDKAERSNAHEAAWSLLAVRRGAYRAGWIAKVTRPPNWGNAATDPEALDFPQVETKPEAWTEAPRSFVLPDRFVVILFSGTMRREETGAAIPDDLVLGPDPLESEGFITRDPATGRIVIDDDLRWLVDFDRAVEVGMALRIPLSPPWNASPIERLVVLGIRASAGAREGRALVERLFESHRYGRGMSIARQGTPTNNTDGAKSGFDSGGTAGETFAVEDDPGSLVATADPLKQSDGQRLAEGLGISLDAARSLPEAAATDVAEAIAMNRALWAATMGGFLRDMMKPLLDDGAIDELQRFFTRFVLGRGLLPAVRVGNQPYGILATSALSKWRWMAEEAAGDGSFWTELLARLVTLDGVWRRLLGNVPYVGKPGDPFELLLSVIGLQASSVEFFSRKAVSDDYLWNYIRFKGTARAYATEAWEELQRQKSENLASLGLLSPMPFRAKQLTFWREHDPLTGPVVDGDPVVPLSEDKGIRPHDGVHNYIDWLTSAARAEIEAQSFKGADGQTVAVPKALVYQMLRHAYLSEFARAGLGFVKVRASAFGEMPEPAVIENVGENRSLSVHDVMNTDTAKIGVTSGSGRLADYLLDHARRGVASPDIPAEVIPLADQTEALRLLASLPTARLERAFAEHLDLCSYRLDAWVQGLFGRRLARLRAGNETGGIYVGAFGFVENLVPATGDRRPVAVSELPASLASEVAGTVVEYANNGGYIHAPSLNHAASAAILRNAYLTHAEPARAGTMSVNLSSSRVRTALSYLDGLRSGQDLAALLGYQLERGLHEEHPGVELDEFIYVLRERFPLISKKLTPVADGQRSEVVEARNVVNGYDLLDFVRSKSYPWDIAGLPADTERSGAIVAEVNRLADAMDAIADVLLAESVHQAANGNMDRGKGVLQAITEGEAPPDIEIVQTPRSGRSLTHRVALALDPSQTSGWNMPLTPRAAANAPLNHWLSMILPPADRIQWKAARASGAPEFVGLDALRLEPIDVVLMSGETLGDFSTEFERFLVYDYRRSRALPDEEALTIDPGSARPDGIPLAAVWQLLKSLRSLVTRGRPLHANDLTLPSEAPTADSGNPKGFDGVAPPLKDLSELKGRVEQALTAIDGAAADLAAFLSGTVAPLYDAFENDPDHAVAPVWGGVLSSLRDKLVLLATAGTAEALPTGGLDVNATAIRALVAQAQALAKSLTKRLTQARELLDITFTDPLPGDPAEAAREKARRTDRRAESYGEAAKILLGRSFVVLPLFAAHTAGQGELAAALAAPVESNPLAIEEWLQSVAGVRAPMEAFAWIAAYHDWFHSATLALVPIQLPVHPGDAWIGGAFGSAAPAGEALSIVLCNPPASVGSPRCGLLVDEWTEVVPAERETTGIAFHYNRPNAQPPQALLLAVAPELRGSWRWDDLVAVVTETLDRAKLRAVEPDHVLQTEYFQLLPALLTEFSARPAFLSTFLADNAVDRVVLS